MKWLDNALVRSPFDFCLCTSKKAFRRLLKKWRLDRDEWPPFLGADGAHATVHFFDFAGAGPAAVVCLGDMSERSTAEVAGLLAHEATHIWQSVREYLGEDEPSSEFEAYSVQSITQALLSEYLRKEGS